MKKFQDLSIVSRSILIYILAIITTVILNPLFIKFYVKFYKPDLIGMGLFIDSRTEILIGGFIVGYILLLSFSVFLLLKEKQWLVWGIGIFIPILMSIGNGAKHTLWALILSALGWLLAQGVLLIRGRVS